MKLLKMRVYKSTNNSIEFDSEIAISDSFFIRAYEVYKQRKLKEGELIEDIIKIALSKNKGLYQLKNGVQYNNEHYYPIIITPSGLKQEDSKHKTEILFIKESELKFREELEAILSGNKIAEYMQAEKVLCTNKDITSRIALATSGAEPVKYMPSICFVDEINYSYSSMYHFEDEAGKLIKDKRELSLTYNDGGGLMSNKMSKIIQAELNLDYKIDFALFRFYHGFACKGVMLRFNFQRYMKENYEYDTDTFKKVDNKYYLKDYFGAWRNIDEIDIILNKSQVKWLNNWKEDILEGQKWEEVVNPYYENSKYKAISKCIYITKVNKAPAEINNKITLNYQVLQNLKISADELIKIAEPLIEQYKKVVAFNDINMIKLCVGDYINKDAESETVFNKISIIIDKLGDEALKIRHIQRTIKNQLEKKLKELAGGKIIVDGGIKMGVADPITYCNFLMNKEAGNNGLKAHEFYIAGQTGDRLSYRNPVAYYAEITKIQLVDSLDYYLKNYTQELFFVNAYDDFLMIKSGADLDGDIFGIVDNEILVNSIIEEEAPFINIKDGTTVKKTFTREQMLEDGWLSSGNLIGKIAMQSSKLSTVCTSYNNLTMNGNVYSYREARDQYLKSIERVVCKEDYYKLKNYILDIRTFEYLHPDSNWDNYEKLNNENWLRYRRNSNNLFKEYLKDSEFKRFYEFSQTEQKELIQQMFYKKRKNFFLILLASQLAIDKPKTLTDIPEKINERLKRFDDLDKARFMHHISKCECKGSKKIGECNDIVPYSSNNVLDKYSAHIIKTLVSPLKTLKNSENDNSIKLLNAISMISNLVEGDVDEDLLSIYKFYKQARELNKNNDEMLNLIDAEAYLKLDKVSITNEDMLFTLKKYKIDTRFLMNFCWNFIYDNLIKLPSKTNTLKEDEKGEYNWNFKYYKVVIADKDYSNISKKEKLKLLVKEGKLIKIRFYGLDDYEAIEIPKTITVTDKNSKILGILYDGERDTVIADGTYTVYNYLIDKSKKGISIFIKIGDVGEGNDSNQNKNYKVD